MSGRRVIVHPNAALEQMLREDDDRGAAQFDPPPPPALLAPPEQVKPLIRPAIPPPDWRAEQASREAAELEPEQPSNPATPNLDEVRRWATKGAP